MCSDRGRDLPVALQGAAARRPVVGRNLRPADHGPPSPRRRCGGAQCMCAVLLREALLDAIPSSASAGGREGRANVCSGVGGALDSSCPALSVNFLHPLATSLDHDLDDHDDDLAAVKVSNGQCSGDAESGGRCSVFAASGIDGGFECRACRVPPSRRPQPLRGAREGCRSICRESRQRCMCGGGLACAGPGLAIGAEVEGVWAVLGSTATQSGGWRCSARLCPSVGAIPTSATAMTTTATTTRPLTTTTATTIATRTTRTARTTKTSIETTTKTLPKFASSSRPRSGSQGIPFPQRGCPLPQQDEVRSLI